MTLKCVSQSRCFSLSSRLITFWSIFSVSYRHLKISVSKAKLIFSPQNHFLLLISPALPQCKQPAIFPLENGIYLQEKPPPPPNTSNSVSTLQPEWSFQKIHLTMPLRPLLKANQSLSFALRTKTRSPLHSLTLGVACNNTHSLTLKVSCTCFVYSDFMQWPLPISAFSQSYGFPSSHIRIWELDHKEGWEPEELML